jgi:hypothetical protein
VKVFIDVGITEEDLSQKLIGFGCDGVAVNMGKYSGVSTLMRENLQPSLITIHCMAHRYNSILFQI